MDFLVLNLLFSRFSTKSTRISPPRNLMGISLKFMAPGFSNPRFERNFAPATFAVVPACDFSAFSVFPPHSNFEGFSPQRTNHHFWIERNNPQPGARCFVSLETWLALFVSLNQRVRKSQVPDAGNFLTRKKIFRRSTRHKQIIHTVFLFPTCPILFNMFSGWWFQPLWKISYSQIGSFPQVGVKITNIGNHHPVFWFSVSSNPLFFRKGNNNSLVMLSVTDSNLHRHGNFPCRWSPVGNGSQTAILCFFLPNLLCYPENAWKSTEVKPEIETNLQILLLVGITPAPETREQLESWKMMKHVHKTMLWL